MNGGTATDREGVRQLAAEPGPPLHRRRPSPPGRRVQESAVAVNSSSCVYAPQDTMIA